MLQKFKPSILKTIIIVTTFFWLPIVQSDDCFALVSSEVIQSDSGNSVSMPVVWKTYKTVDSCNKDAQIHLTVTTDIYREHGRMDWFPIGNENSTPVLSFYVGCNQIKNKESFCDLSRDSNGEEIQPYVINYTNEHFTRRLWTFPSIYNYITKKIDRQK